MRGLQKTFPDQLVMSRAEIRRRTIIYILTESGIGQSIGMGVIMSLFCGFAIVSLTMFSAVVDHVREFGTLKAIGATNMDLAKLLLAQARDLRRGREPPSARRSWRSSSARSAGRSFPWPCPSG